MQVLLWCWEFVMLCEGMLLQPSFTVGLPYCCRAYTHVGSIFELSCLHSLRAAALLSCGTCSFIIGRINLYPSYLHQRLSSCKLRSESSCTRWFSRMFFDVFPLSEVPSRGLPPHCARQAQYTQQTLCYLWFLKCNHCQELAKS
jgi:hypothetical protein